MYTHKYTHSHTHTNTHQLTHTHTRTYKHYLTPLVPTGFLLTAFSWLICCSIGQEEKQTSSEHTHTHTHTRTHTHAHTSRSSPRRVMWPSRHQGRLVGRFPDGSDFSDLPGHKNTSRVNNALAVLSLKQLRVCGEMLLNQKF